MTRTTPPDPKHDFPPDAVAFATREAHLDADRTAAYLAAAGLGPGPGGSVGIDRGLLLDLGAALRLRAWDAAGLTVHTEAGLPDGDRAFRGLIDALDAAGRGVRGAGRFGGLGAAVFTLLAARFAWAAPAELGADVLLDAPDEEALVEALARFLLSRRTQEG